MGTIGGFIPDGRPLALVGLVMLGFGALSGPSSQAQERGDVIVAFEMVARHSTNVDIGAQRISCDGRLLWGDGGKSVEVAASAAVETSPAACDDGQGGALVAYVHEFVDGKNAGDKDIVVQHLDRNGRRLWSEPKPVAESRNAETQPIAVSDGQGGAIVIYLATTGKGDSDLLAQRIGPDGRLLWNEGKTPVVLGASRNLERNACAVPDGYGGLFVFFEWVGTDGDVNIRGQHVTADGRTPWMTAHGALNIAASPQNESHPVAASDGAGGAIVAFEMEFTSGENRGDIDIMAQRVSGGGQLLWGNAATPKAVGAAPALERNPVIVADGAGGAIAAFEMEPVTGENKGDVDVLAQRLDAAGNLRWGEGKRSVAVSSSGDLERWPALVADGDGGIIAAIELEFRGGANQHDRNIIAQRLSALGTMQWNEGKKSASVATAAAWLEERPIALSDGDGGALIVYPATARSGQDEGDQDLEACRIDGSGKHLWQNGGRSVDLAATELLERKPSAFVASAAKPD